MSLLLWRLRFLGDVLADIWRMAAYVWRRDWRAIDDGWMRRQEE